MTLTVGRTKSVGDASGAGSTFNIANYLPRMAEAAPERSAVVEMRACRPGRSPLYGSISFAELERLSNRCANGLASAGFERGMRVLVMVRPGVEFVALVFALFKLRAVPVMIDPGMGVGRLLECIRQVELDAFVGVPKAHVIRVLRPAIFERVEHIVTVGRRWFWGGPTLQGLCATATASSQFAIAETPREETAAILFTSGSTGPAKGVVYQHGTFDAQIRMIQTQYSIEPGEVDLATFPLFALFSIAMGMTVVIPDMDPSHPARVDPARIVRAVQDHRITSSFGSPAIWRRVAPYCTQRGIKLPTLRRILIAGAPVPWQVIEQLHRVIEPEGEVHTPYGATESLPVTSISGRELLGDLCERNRRGAGTCVGRPLTGIELRIIRITDDPILEWSDDLTLPDGERGEIVVAGPVVTEEYFGLPHATRLAKIHDGDTIWHRMGDIGYRDEQGRVWFCGRKSHRVVTKRGTMFTDCCEPVFNQHEDVSRSALVGVGPKGKQRPVIVVETEPGRSSPGRQRRTLQGELLALARANPTTEEIHHVLFRRNLPVDVRHNAKINREKLAVWAGRRLA